MRHESFRPPQRRAPLHLVVVGGGASGVLLAAHVLRRDAQARVTIIEARHMLGCGVAYSTTDPDHLLNTRVLNMSAWPAEPDDFLTWLSARPEGAGLDGQSFVSRATYGHYLRGLTAPWSAATGDGRLSCLRDTCLRVEETGAGVVAHLAGGGRVAGDILALATGHVQEEADPEGLVTGPWQAAGEVDPDGRIVIVGAGLSMVDQVISLLKAGHRGQIVALSRRGQLPRPHAATRPLAVAPSDVPLGAPVSRIMGWARGLARRAEAEGGTWRDAVDGIRPHVRAIWRSLPVAARARFLRHASGWWDVHRHRMPPESHDRLSRAIARGQVILQRGGFEGASRDPSGGLVARLRPAGGPSAVLSAARIIDCRGIRRDPVANASPLVADLLARGRARVDPLRIGLEVDAASRVVAADGTADARLIAIGPAARAAFWEITAIPDIRDQAETLARALLDPLPAADGAPA